MAALQTAAHQNGEPNLAVGKIVELMLKRSNI